MSNDDLDSMKLREYLGKYSEIFTPEFFPEINSTNTYLKNRVTNDPGLKTWHTVIASAQSAGRGRKGRSFLSPAGTGLYLSVLLRPGTDTETSERITTKAAVAACLAIEECTGEKTGIKWVNDIFVRGKKAAGILTEGCVEPGELSPKWVVMGIGFNVFEPEGGFPKELKEIAGAITRDRDPDLRARIASVFLKEFYRICSGPNEGYYEEYRQRSFIPGNRINVISGDSVIPAYALDVDRECHLVVRYEDGREETLSSGEVSVRMY